MLYTLSSDFIKLNETSGTVQNSSSICTLEISETPTPDSGILIFPLQKHSFKDTQLFLRSIDGFAQARVVPFELDHKGGDSLVDSITLNGEQLKIASNKDILLMLEEIFGKED